MKFSKNRFKNIVFFVFIVLFVLPQTRLPIQVILHKGLMHFNTLQAEHIVENAPIDYNWVLEDKNGTNFNLSDTKGKVVLINFWATWCPPCIAEMPSLQELYTDYKHKIKFVFISNEDLLVVNKFLNKYNYNFTVYNPQTRYPEAFNVKNIPRTFIIDKKGNIIIDKTGAANWNGETTREIINKLLL